MTLLSRSAIRKEIRHKRRRLSASERKKYAEDAAAVAGGEPLLFRARHIACYIANDGELNPAPLIKRIMNGRKACYLPVIGNDGKLWFAPYAEGDRMVLNRFGIPEPARGPLVHSRVLDVILMPLVAFDGQGNRLGMGAGYYDRTLAFLRHRWHWRKPRIIGLAYEFQRVPALPAEPWDVPLDGIITEAGFYKISR